MEIKGHSGKSMCTAEMQGAILSQPSRVPLDSTSSHSLSPLSHLLLLPVWLSPTWDHNSSRNTARVAMMSPWLRCAGTLSKL